MYPRHFGGDLADSRHPGHFSLKCWSWRRFALSDNSLVTSNIVDRTDLLHLVTLYYNRSQYMSQFITWHRHEPVLTRHWSSSPDSSRPTHQHHHSFPKLL